VELSDFQKTLIYTFIFLDYITFCYIVSSVFQDQSNTIELQTSHLRNHNYTKRI